VLVVGFLGQTFKIVLLAITALTGVLSVLREFQVMYLPAAAGKQKMLWGFVRVAFVIAAFLAYADEHQKVSDLSRDRPIQVNVSAIKVPPAQVVVNSSPPASPPDAARLESPNSLRRRIKRLADEMEAFWQERQEHHPPYANGDPKATGEQARINEASNKYDRETGPQCLSGFEDRTREIIEELKTKGVDVTSGFWEGMIEQHRCIGAFELKDFRALAYRVDAADKLVVF